MYRAIGMRGPVRQGLLNGMLTQRTRRTNPEAVDALVGPMSRANRGAIVRSVHSGILNRTDLSWAAARITCPTLMIATLSPRMIAASGSRPAPDHLRQMKDARSAVIRGSRRPPVARMSHRTRRARDRLLGRPRGKSTPVLREHTHPEGGATMRIVVFGASGGTGANVVDRALAEGHEVVAAARRPDAVRARDRLTIVRCDVLDAAAVAAAMSGGEAVICTIGPASNRKPGTVISVGTRNLVAGCVACGITRFVFESGLMVSDGRELSMSGRLAIRLAGWVFWDRRPTRSWRRQPSPPVRWTGSSSAQPISPAAPRPTTASPDPRHGSLPAKRSRTPTARRPSSRQLSSPNG